MPPNPRIELLSFKLLIVTINPGVAGPSESLACTWQGLKVQGWDLACECGRGRVDVSVSCENAKPLVRQAKHNSVRSKTNLGS